MPGFKITVPKRGLSEGKSQVQVEAEGYTGAACIASTDKIIKAMGTIVKREETSDYYRQPENEVVVGG